MKRKLFLVLGLFVLATIASAQNFFAPTGGPTGAAVQALAINPVGDVLAGTNGTGVYRLLNSAPSWTHPTTGLTDSIVFAVGFAANQNVYAGTSRGLFVSLDNGSSWSTTQLTPFPVLSIAFQSPTVILVGLGNSGGVYRSTDAGSSWNSTQLGGLSVQAITIKRSNGYIFAGTSTEGVYFSTNGGGAWANSGLTGVPVASLAVDSAGNIFAGTIVGVARSTDSGVSWTSAGLTNFSIRALIVNAGGHIFAGADNAIFRSKDNGATWNGVGTGLQNLQVSALGLNSAGFLFAGNNVAGGPSGVVHRSTSSTVTPPAPVLASPANGAVNQPVTLNLTWNAAVGAATYRLQVSANATFTSIVYDDSTLSSTSQPVASLANGTQYFWRVNAKNLGGTSSYSAARSFTTVVAVPSAPTLVSPPNGSNQSPTLQLSWSPSAGASTYRLQVSIDPAFSSTVFDDSTLVASPQQVGLTANTTYYWHVNAKNGGGTSVYSTTWNFTTSQVPPAVPTLAFPPDGSLGQATTLLLSWNASAGAATYRLQLSLDSAFAPPLVVDDATIAGTSRLVGPLSDTTVYYWRVSAANSFGPSAFSPFRDFKTRGTPRISVIPRFLDFAGIAIGSALVQKIAMNSIGTDSLRVDSARVRGADAVDFSIVSASGPFPPLAPSASESLRVQFSPLTLGSKSGLVIIYSNAGTSPDTVIANGEGNAPAIQVTINGSPVSGNDLGLTVAPPVGVLFTSQLLYYRNGGETIFQVTQLAPVGPDLQGTIPQDYLNIRGIEYYIELADTGQGFVVTFPDVNPTINPAIIRVRVGTAASPVQLERQKYKMISVPLDSLQLPGVIGTLGDDYGTYQRNLWRVFRYENGSYVEHPAIEATFIPGTAFWLITHSGSGFDADNGVSVNSSQSFILTLPPGFSQIADPFAFPVSWGSIVKSGRVKGPYYFNGNEYSVDTTGNLLPWEGYFVLNEEAFPVTLTIPDSQPTAPPVPPQSAAHGYALQLIATSGDQRDGNNVIGLHENASDVSDGLDFPEPPSIAGNLHLSIVDEGVGFMRNFKSVNSTGQQWQVALSAAGNSTINVSLDATGNLPQGFRLYIVDEDEGHIMTNNSFAVQISNNVRHLRFVLGTEEYAHNALGGIPLTPVQYSLEQNFPNPFNPETIIRYQLGKRSTVVLEIYDVLGRRVRTLVNGEQASGTYSATWNGLDQAGRATASGIYIYRLNAGEFVATQKMLLVR